MRTVVRAGVRTGVKIWEGAYKNHENAPVKFYKLWYMWNLFLYCSYMILHMLSWSLWTTSLFIPKELTISELSKTTADILLSHTHTKVKVKIVPIVSLLACLLAVLSCPQSITCCEVCLLLRLTVSTGSSYWPFEYWSLVQELHCLRLSLSLCSACTNLVSWYWPWSTCPLNFVPNCLTLDPVCVTTLS